MRTKHVAEDKTIESTDEQTVEIRERITRGERIGDFVLNSTDTQTTVAWLYNGWEVVLSHPDGTWTVIRLSTFEDMGPEAINDSTITNCNRLNIECNRTVGNTQRQHSTDPTSSVTKNETDSESTDTCIELSDEAAAATKTALNDVRWYDLAGTIWVKFGETTISAADKPVALTALHKQRESLERVEGNPTLYDPNGEDVYLEWTRTAIEELTTTEEESDQQ